MPTLLLTWHPNTTYTTPPPPSSTATQITPQPAPASLVHRTSETSTMQQEPPTSRAARRRQPNRDAPVGMRTSERLAAKENGMYISATDKATQLKALQNSLAQCSKPVQQLVAKKKLLTKTKKPMSAPDLQKLSDAVGLGEATAKALDQIIAIGNATGRELDRALAGRHG